MNRTWRREPVGLTLNQQLNADVACAKSELIDFMRRTGRNPELRKTHERLQRRGIKVIDIVTNDLNKPKSWLTLKFSYGRRRWLNKDELRKICVKIELKYWREMRTREQMGCLLILHWMDGIDIGSDAIVGDQE